MLDFIHSGTLTSVPGFLAGAIHCGIKRTGEADLGLLYSSAPCIAAGLFTRNRVKSCPVRVSLDHLQQPQARAIIAHSGCANACVGERGMSDAVEMTRLAGAKLPVPAEQVLVAGTGVIGTPLPMDRVRAGMESIQLRRDGGHAFARAIMTTDTMPKEAAISLYLGTAQGTIAGVAKGAGMIHPDLATLLVFLATDAAVQARFLRSALKRAIADSFNLLSIDGDTSPSDSVFLLANGLAGNKRLNERNGAPFEQALTELCQHLAGLIARDGEGATKAIKVVVEGASNEQQAAQAARTIVSSSLVKSAMHGNDPNWGRIVTALGRSGAELDETKLEVHLNDICVMRAGIPVPFDSKTASASLAREQVSLTVRLHLGQAAATARGCDLSEEYVTINSTYTT